MKLSFYKRVVLLLCGLVLLVQLCNLSVVLTTISTDVKREMRSDLVFASTLVDQLIKRRSDLLLTNAEVLAAEFGFRYSIAKQDEATVRSALLNSIARVDADLAAFITLDRRIIASTSNKTTSDDQSAYNSLINRAELNGKAAATLVIDGIAREVVGVPVKSAIGVGWLVLGFSLHDAIAGDLAKQVGMQITFAAGSDDYEYFGSSFDKATISGMPLAIQRMQETDFGLVTSLFNEDFLTHVVPISSEQTPVVALLHTSLDASLAGYRGVRNRLQTYMAISLFVAVALAFWFARGVTRPVTLLSQAAVRIREGDYQTELDNTLDSQRSDELGELIKTFDEMQTCIAAREAKILHQANHDELTQLPNLRMARKRLGEMTEHNLSDQSNTGVIVLGLNRYKQICGTLGYSFGEQMMLALSERLRVESEYDGLVARISTDQFLILLKNSSSTACELTAVRLIEALKTPIALEDAEVVPDLSAGFILVPEHATNADIAIRRASIALADTRDEQKLTGTYELGRDERHMRRLSIIADLKRAVQEDELTVHFQPKIHMQTGEVTSVESLVRWIHPERGFMPPDEFIDLAESSGNIGLVTQWVLNAVVEQISVWETQGIKLKAAVNLSALDLQDESLFPRIQSLLDTYGVPTSRLIVEVTESAMMRDTERAHAVLSHMRSEGILISIDDFGTGYSSMAKLKDLPIDELKIDRAFVTDIEAGTTKAKIIKAVIDLGHSMNLTVISEGVETQAEWDLLKELGNDVVQGYLISRPLVVEDFDKWWRENYPTGQQFVA